MKPARTRKLALLYAIGGGLATALALASIVLYSVDGDRTSSFGGFLAGAIFIFGGLNCFYGIWSLRQQRIERDQ